MVLNTLHRTLPTLAAAAVLVAGTAGYAAVFEDFQFNDTNGTELGAAANSANPGNLWMNSVEIDPGPPPVFGPAPGDVADSFVQDGVFSIKKADDLFSTRHMQIDNITSGVRYLVVDIAGWNIVADNGAELEDVGWAFLDNDTGYNGSFITAQARFIVFTPTVLRLEGTAIGTGATPTSTVDFGVSKSTPLTLAIKLDADNDTYEVLYKDDVAPWASLGAASLGLKSDESGPREGNSIRWRINNNFGALGEFFDIDRIYLTDADPTTFVPLTGDLDGDGFVGITDLNIVLGAWNQNVAPGSLANGDPSGDGFVGIEDLNVVLGNWNAGTPPVADGTAVPEPGALALLALGGVALVNRRK